MKSLNRLFSGLSFQPRRCPAGYAAASQRANLPFHSFSENRLPSGAWAAEGLNRLFSGLSFLTGMLVTTIGCMSLNRLFSGLPFQT